MNEALLTPLPHTDPPELQREFLINCTPYETRVAVVENGVVQELHIERAARRGLVGNIYRGKVVRVLPGMQSAFVEIGLSRTAFLHVTDLALSATGNDGLRIERRLAEGDWVTVQIIKDPIGAKGARLTEQISLAGRYLVYLPHDAPHVGVSQKIDDDAERTALRERLRSLLPPGETGGYIVRTNAADASDEALLADIAYLKQLWNDICAKAIQATEPSLLYAELDLALRVVRDLSDRATTRILIDSRENADRLIAFAQQYAPHLVPLIERYRGERPLFAHYQAEEELERALARRVELKSGGYLIFDQTEALTTIDVNTGAFVGTKNLEETILKTNLEAAQTIARQLRLRNLGGIILVDFIDMAVPEHRQRVLDAFKEALSRDHTKIAISGFTQLGLVELTRKRTRESLAQQLCEPCPTCSGRGYIKSAETLAFEILRALIREARAFPNACELKILAPVAVVDRLRDEYAPALALVSEFLGKPVSLYGDTDYPPEHYDIVLL
ncbi:MAG: Rne/Rng family ribonuclease [Hydrogenophilus sp.]|nr:Rne/Rng family ribonuclease [Hydrogenophilus sp.]